MIAVLRRSLADGGGVAGIEELAATILAHAEREQAGLFAALRNVGVDQEYLGLFERDHRRIDDLLARANTEPSAVETLIELVEDHIRREETDMFPAARQLLDPAQWDAVDDAGYRAVAR